MRNLLLLILSSCFLFSCDTIDTASISHIAVSSPVIGSGSIVLGFIIGMLWQGKKYQRQKRRTPGNKRSIHHNAMDRDALSKELSQQEQTIDSLKANLKSCENEKDDLKRKLNEAERLSQMEFRKRERSMMPEDLHGISDPVPANTTTTYYLKPSKDGTFKESSKVTELSEALYQLTINNENPSEAAVTFIDSTDNVFGALQNEAGWLLVVCDRSNFPGPQTKSIRTDAPGKAIFKNREWQMIQKVKITYL